MMSNKRGRAEMEDSIVVTMAKCLMLLSRDKGGIDFQSVIDQQQMRTTSSTQDRVYECKTCNKQFLSFQALGGHRASHKTRPVMDLYSSDDQRVNDNQKQAKEVKIHECSICGLKFAAGQALGGHMRRHRSAMIESSTTIAGTGLSSDIATAATHQEEVVPQVSVLKRSQNRRVLSLNMDVDLSLSLQPLDNNDLEFSTDVKAPGKHISTPSMIYEMEGSMAATMTKCLMLLSRDSGEIDYGSVIEKQRMPTSSRGRTYECKTCNKRFPSFQALGGHRTSHKKPRLMELYSSDNQAINDNQQQAKKPKIHGCSICGLKFPIGQALGGHMRKHRAAMIESSSTTATAETTTTGLSSSSSDNTNISFQEKRLPHVPVLKRSSSGRRVLIMMSNKRSRGEIEESMAATMAKCLMILSRDRGEIDYQSMIQQKIMPSSIQGRVYECKTCDKQFPSFQALGGHRASHKKPRLMELYSSGDQIINENQQQAKKQKGHECSICGLTFAIGQALGGHMRKHRAAMLESSSTTATAETTTGLSASSSDNANTSFQEERLQVQVLKRLNSSRRVLSLNLDLSLSLLPLDHNNDFAFSTIVNADKHTPSSPSIIYSFI
ncbi:hypothetical protein MKW92_043991 [Papaver armeniacum]|nr:hypothetical protein MKW92_043991 [Papaver armeniacum]